MEWAESDPRELPTSGIRRGIFPLILFCVRWLEANPGSKLGQRSKSPGNGVIIPTKWKFQWDVGEAAGRVGLGPFLAGELPNSRVEFSFPAAGLMVAMDAGIECPESTSSCGFAPFPIQLFPPQEAPVVVGTEIH